MSSPNMAPLLSTRGSLVLFLSLSLALPFLQAQETLAPGDVTTSPIHEGTPVETTQINLTTSPPAQGAETMEEPKDVTYVNPITSPPAQGAETTEEPKDVTYVTPITSPPAQGAETTEEPKDVTTPKVPASMDGTTVVGQPTAAATQDAAINEDTATTDPLSDVTTSSTVDEIGGEAPTATLAGTLTVSEEAPITTEGAAEALTMTVSETALVPTEGPTDALTTTTTTTSIQTTSIPPGSELATDVAVNDDPTPNITSAPSQLPTTTPLKKSRGFVPDPNITHPPPATSQPPVHIEDRGGPELWIVVVALLAGVMCVGGVLCICLLAKRRRQSRSGKWTRKSKGRGEGDDAWAGPVKLRGEECDGGGPAGKAEEGVRDEEAMVLSTFAPEDEGGEGGGPRSPVGEEGSKEVKIWEEEAPLLYIDEDASDEGIKPANKTNSIEKGMGGGGEGVGNGLSMPGEMNGGSAFCLTTAV